MPGHQIVPSVQIWRWAELEKPHNAVSVVETIETF